MRHLTGADARVGGTLIHCSAGKDRTGVLAAVVLSLVGVDDEAISSEYELTQLGLAERIPVTVARLVASGAFDDMGGKEAAERMVGSKKESMMATLQYIREKYGSVEDYVTKVCGLTQAEVDALRRRFVGAASSGGQAAL
jgi:protein tyrosine/serine phosphatase